MRFTRRLICSASFACLAFGAPAAHAQTLIDAIDAAYANNPGLEVSRALTEAADEDVVQARALYGPSINLEVSHTYTLSRIDAGLAVLENDGFTTNGVVNLSQPLFTSGRLAANLDSAQAQREGRRETLRGDSQQLILDVITAYASLRRDLELYDVAAETYELLLQQRDLTTSRFNLRDATAPDVDQTEQRMQLAAGQVLQARGNIEQSAARFRNLAGSYPDELAPLPDLPPLASIEELYLQAERSSPEILNSLYTEAASRAQLASARAARLPQLTGEISGGRLALDPFFNEPGNQQVTAGVTLLWPLYQGGAQASRVREALDRNIAAQNFVEQTRRDVRESLASDYNQYRAAELAVPRFLSAVAAAERSVEGVQRQQTAGLRTLRDVLDVTSDLFDARSSAVIAQTNGYIAHASALRDAGLLTIDLFVKGAADGLPEVRSGGAGLPLRPVIDALEAGVLANDPAKTDIPAEQDTNYDAGARLANPLQP